MQEKGIAFLVTAHLSDHSLSDLLVKDENLNLLVHKKPMKISHHCYFMSSKVAVELSHSGWCKQDDQT